VSVDSFLSRMLNSYHFGGTSTSKKVPCSILGIYFQRCYLYKVEFSIFPPSCDVVVYLL
jgi:hypothetical protein